NFTEGYLVEGWVMASEIVMIFQDLTKPLLPALPI
ncbi:uncharacterized protein METZ01_LOCUS373777, partial [marine metagenome]